MTNLRYDSSVLVRGALDRMGLSPLELAALLVHWGDPRPRSTVYRAVGRFTSAKHVRATPWMLRALLHVMETAEPPGWRADLPEAVEAWEEAERARASADDTAHAAAL